MNEYIIELPQLGEITVDFESGPEFTIEATGVPGPQGDPGIPGQDGVVQDVQVNGTSILDAQGVANITPADLSFTTQVTGTTPTITALSGIQYVCGEVSTLDITLPESGIVDVVFESGSTPTVLTINPPAGVTEVNWADGWDEVCEANTTYELNIMNGKLGVKGAWT